MIRILSRKYITLISGFLLLISLAFISPAFSQTVDPIDKLTRLIEKDSKNAQLYIERGDVYFGIREFFDAVKD